MARSLIPDWCDWQTTRGALELFTSCHSPTSDFTPPLSGPTSCGLHTATLPSVAADSKYSSLVFPDKEEEEEEEGDGRM